MGKGRTVFTVDEVSVRCIDGRADGAAGRDGEGDSTVGGDEGRPSNWAPGSRMVGDGD